MVIREHFWVRDNNGQLRAQYSLVRDLLRQSQPKPVEKHPFYKWIILSEAQVTQYAFFIHKIILRLKSGYRVLYVGPNSRMVVK